MANDADHPFSDKAVCVALVQHGLITKAHALEIFEKKDKARESMEKQKARRSQSIPMGGRIINPTTIVDIIVSFKFNRADRPDLELDEDIIFKALAKTWGKPYRKLDPLKLDLNLVTTTIPRSFAMKHLVLPVEVDNGKLVVATSNPFNPEVFEDIARVSMMAVNAVVTSKTDIIRLIDEFFGFKRSIAAAETQFASPSYDLGNLEQYVRLKSVDELPVNDHHVINAVNHLFSYAFDQRASDIHIEPKRDASLIRMRIDGVLHTVYRLPKKVHSPVVSRIKNMSRLDMAEKRRPQDGRIKTAKGDVEVEIRISTVPVAFGEKVVMRVMDPDILFQDLDHLGFTPHDLERYNYMVNRPNGLVLVCGPTGSGKSTTLYSTLRRLSTPEINTTTIEDPIEMVHEEFNQIAVQPAVNITFATIIRNILRQDPDIIMVGELRDLETAQNAVQAALTGHLVLSTLHTNDAPSSIIRLLDIGVPHFLVQATLTGVISQRLVRKICPKCIEPYEIDASELVRMGIDVKKQGPVTLYHGTGCAQCRGTGYFGRIAIFEALPYTKALKKITTRDTDLAMLREVAFKENLVSLRENAIQKLVDGVTTREEVVRVTWENE
ncbi:MAG: type II/IV secretion system protein [Desulfobacteraceae bacterium]|nr:MAG: type II/IV secretion system protein [Desulfobacteraceae bacterium]